MPPVTSPSAPPPVHPVSARGTLGDDIVDKVVAVKLSGSAPIAAWTWPKRWLAWPADLAGPRVTQASRDDYEMPMLALCVPRARRSRIRGSRFASGWRVWIEAPC